MAGKSTQNRIAQFERLCRGRGLPVTTQRRTIFETILDREDHPTADQIHDQVRGRIHTISRTTVYRILDTLVELGLITKICHHGSAARFDPKIHQHHHLVCLHCDSIVDLEEQRLNEVMWPDVRGRGFEITDYHIHFRGICAACREKRDTGAGARRKTSPRRPERRTRAKPGRSVRKRKNPTRRPGSGE
jgi:Fur family transcriptional regulator, peroxide stress response regulator